ncbi:DUF3363 domain-containing protein [Pseudoxanthomonas sp. GM95]|uniref:DUF3363 domain-containing protein n=1 Tax=Pseudoxanthomonas sp. GM95 TaxID=1881043 RepID=UPI000B856EA7|nr:DUF3363 domain-containing protein [Pseudoxanthomonas sp. GM95]
MNGGDEEYFRPRLKAPRQRGDGFLGKVLRQANQAGTGLPKPGGRMGPRPASRLGRGHVAARFLARDLGRGARRVAVKVRLVNLARSTPRSTAMHLRYIERDGVDRHGGPGRAYGPSTDACDVDAFEARGRGDRHQFRMIISPEDAEQLGDLRTYTRRLMAGMEGDLGTRLEWTAVDHWDTDNPHTHVVLRGKDQAGKDLIIAGDYIANGIRHRASGLANEWLGHRSKQEIEQAYRNQVKQARWTGLDRILQGMAPEGLIKSQALAATRLHAPRALLVGRLHQLQAMGLATSLAPGQWTIAGHAEATLRTMGERGDILRTMQRALGNRQRGLVVLEAGTQVPAICGCVLGKGLADELNDSGYLVVDATDGRAYYVALPRGAGLEEYPLDAIVHATTNVPARAADRSIASLSEAGLYRAARDLAALVERQVPEPQAMLDGHVRRLEALRRAGIVERIGDGLWRVPQDLVERGRAYDAQRLGAGLQVELKTHLPIARQVRAIGATWLDQQLVGGAGDLGSMGFGGQVRQALGARSDFLVELGLARKRDQRIVLPRNLLRTLRTRELARVGQTLTKETGLVHLPLADGQRVAGIYRRDLMLASGRFAMLDDGRQFSLVPWKPVIAPRIGQQLAATSTGLGISWDISARRGPQI